MRTPVLLLVVFLLLQEAHAQVVVRDYFDTFPNAGPQLDRCTGLANGDVLYYDQGWTGVARLAPDGAVQWYQRLSTDPDPQAFTTVGHAAERADGILVLALVQRFADGSYHPGVAALAADGAVQWMHLEPDLEVGVLDWLRVVVDHGPQQEVHLLTRSSDDGGLVHRFSAAGAPLGSISFSGNSDLPVEVLAEDDGVVGACVGRIQRYATDWSPGWSFQPGISTVGGLTYSSSMWDVVPVPGGYAFAFLRNGGPSLMMPGIGLLNDAGQFQQAVVFDITALQSTITLMDRPRMAATADGLAVVVNTGSSGNAQGWLLTCDLDLTAPRMLRVELGDEAYPRSVAAAGSGLVLSGFVDQQGSGERMIARSALGTDMGGCFPPEPFFLQEYPMPPQVVIPGAPTPVNSNWQSVELTAIAATLQQGVLCTAQSVDALEDLAPLQVLPNPTTGPLQIHADERTASGELLDAQGRSVLQWGAQAGTFSLDLGPLAPGVYTVVLRDVLGAVRYGSVVRE